MTPQEIHIALDAELQKINSFSTKSLEAQEKDYFLNNESLKFIKQRTNSDSNSKQTGFEDTVKRLDDIQELIKPLRSQIQINNQGESFITLPSDYFSYVVSSLYMKRDCIDERIRKEEFKLYNIYTELNLPSTTLTTYNIKLLIDGIAVTLFDLSMLPLNYLSTTLEFVRQDFLLIDALKIIIPRELKKNKISYTQLYWDRRGKDFNPFSFTLDILSEGASIIIEVNNDSHLFNTEEIIINSVSLKKFPLKRKLRLVNEEFLPSILESDLSGSTLNSPVCVVRTGEILIIPPNGVIADWVETTYICKPTPINLLLNSGFNLNDNSIKEIISNTARYIKAIIADPNYQAYAQENLITE